PQQAAYLDSLLNDNAVAINDAIARRDQWAQAFEGNWDFSYDTYQDRALYIAYLHYQLDRQQAIINEAYQSGMLTDPQAQDMKTRILVIRNSETGCYDLNRRLDLTPNQINRLQQMVDDNNRFIRFRTHRERGRWKGDHYAGWTGQRKQYANNPWLNNHPLDDGSNQGQTNGAHYWDGRPFQRQAPAPTATPVPYHAAAPTATPVPHHAAIPTATPVPVAQAKPTVPVSIHPNHPDHPDHPLHPDHPGHPGTSQNTQAAAPTATPIPAVSNPNPEPTRSHENGPAWRNHQKAAWTPTPQPAAPSNPPTPVPTVAPSASNPATAAPTPDQSGNGDQTDQSDHPDHPGHPHHPGHPGNSGNDDNSQGSDQGN
ncbi:MAG TPA: hypothetical protein VJ873_11210, partial [bacterium]|nr:hypothetical protein [bacterium]